MAGAVQRYTTRELDGYLQPDEQSVTVTTGQTLILPNDPERVQVLITNLGAVDVWVRFTRGLVAGTGIRIPASGGGLQLILTEDFFLTAWELFGVVASGTAVVFVTSLRRQSESQ